MGSCQVGATWVLLLRWQRPASATAAALAAPGRSSPSVVVGHEFRHQAAGCGACCGKKNSTHATTEQATYQKDRPAIRACPHLELPQLTASTGCRACRRQVCRCACCCWRRRRNALRCCRHACCRQGCAAQLPTAQQWGGLVLRGSACCRLGGRRAAPPAASTAAAAFATADVRIALTTCA